MPTKDWTTFAFLLSRDLAHIAGDLHDLCKTAGFSLLFWNRLFKGRNCVGWEVVQFADAPEPILKGDVRWAFLVLLKRIEKDIHDIAYSMRESTDCEDTVLGEVADVMERASKELEKLLTALRRAMIEYEQADMQNKIDLQRLNVTVVERRCQEILTRMPNIHIRSGGNRNRQSRPNN